jgi:hypothetical protein
VVVPRSIGEAQWYREDARCAHFNTWSMVMQVSDIHVRTVYMIFACGARRPARGACAYVSQVFTPPLLPGPGRAGAAAHMYRH